MANRELISQDVIEKNHKVISNYLTVVKNNIELLFKITCVRYRFCSANGQGDKEAPPRVMKMDELFANTRKLLAEILHEADVSKWEVGCFGYVRGRRVGWRSGGGPPRPALPSFSPSPPPPHHAIELLHRLPQGRRLKSCRQHRVHDGVQVAATPVPARKVVPSDDRPIGRDVGRHEHGRL
jgi:hypothetical protein